MNTRYFGFVTKNPLKIIIAWKEGQENPSDYFMKHNSAKHHKHACLIYLQTDKTPQLVPLILIKPDLQGCVDTEDSNMEESCKTFLIPRI